MSSHMMTQSTSQVSGSFGHNRDRSSRKNHVRASRPFKFFVNAGWFILGVALLVIFCLAPFYWMVVTSIKDPSSIFNNALWPEHVSFENYTAVFSSQNHFGRALINSVIIAGGTTIIAMLAGILCAYAVTRMRFRGKRYILIAVLAASMFPGVAILTPLYSLFSSIHWIDTYQAMIIPDISFALPLAVWTLTSFFREIPWELEEAALVDGATHGVAFRKIIVPLAAPGVFTTTILVFIQSWNEYLISSNVSITPETNPVTVSIAKFTGASQYEQPFGTQMAAGVIATLPLIIVVLIFQRKIVAGLTAGAVKS